MNTPSSAAGETSAERRAFQHFLRTGRRLDLRTLEEPLEFKFNPYHDPRNGQFTFAPGGSREGGGSGLPQPERVHPARAAAAPKAGTGRPVGTQSIGRDEAIRKIGDAIASGEGNYESYNTGTRGVKDGKVGYSYLRPPAGTVTDKTIDGILATEALSGNNPKRLFAVGKYQVTSPTLRDAKKRLGLTGKERLTPALQEKIFRDFLLPKAGSGALGRFVQDGECSVEDAQFAAAQRWASIGVPKGYPDKKGIISDGYRSFHESAANHANRQATDAMRSSLSELAKAQKKKKLT